MEPIDAVITWVDGDDPVMTRKRNAHMNGSSLLERDDIGGITRFRSLGELDWCVCSIMKYAPFIRRIFIVTDGQNPHLDESIRTFCPGSEIPVEIVDHKVIFRGYEQYLPVFNSCAIETMLWRIPGLSDKFLYFNDDVMLWNPLKLSDFFDGDRIVAYGRIKRIAPDRIGMILAGMKKNPRVTFLDSMINAAMLWTGHIWGSFIKLTHTPHAMRRTFFEKFFNKNPESILSNIRFKFRDREQFNTVEFGLLDAMSEGNIIIRNPREYLLYIEPRTEENDAFVKTLREWSKLKRPLFCCLDSLDRGSEEQRRILSELVREHLSE